MNHCSGGLQPRPFYSPAALTFSNNSCAAVINLHRIYKLLKQRSPFLLAAQLLDSVWGPGAKRREHQTERSALSYQAWRCLLIALPREAAIDQDTSPFQPRGKHTFCLFSLIEQSSPCVVVLVRGTLEKCVHIKICSQLHAVKKTKNKQKKIHLHCTDINLHLEFVP